MNVKRPNNFITKSTLCNTCNTNINIDDFFQHKEKCSSFKQSFKSKQSVEKDSNPNKLNSINSLFNLNNNSNSASPFLRSDSNFKKKDQDGDGFDDDAAAVTFGSKNSKKMVEELKNNIIYNDHNDIDGDMNNLNHLNLNKPNFNSTNYNPTNKNVTAVVDNLRLNFGSFRDEETNQKKNLSSTNDNFKSNKSIQNLGILNKLQEHNSFLSVIIQAFYNMTKIRNFIMNEMTISETDFKNSLLLNLQNVMKKINSSEVKRSNMQNSNSLYESISILDLRRCLSDNFQSRRKFLIEYPDDPVDVYYALINSFHSFHIKSNLSEVKDTSCEMKCISHKYFYMDLYSVEECECKGLYKRLYSYHNYVFDLPVDKILKLAENNLIQIPSSNNQNLISDMKGKLFYYFKNLLNQIKLNCPEKGIRCTVNKITKTLYLSNIPSFIAYNLQQNNINYCNKNLIEILKIFVMIPKVFELSNIFITQDKNKYFYELLGAVCISPNKNYTSFFKNTSSISSNSNPNILWNHFDDEKVTNFSCYSDLISHCLKYSDAPILIFYQLNEKFNERDRDLTLEDITKFERFCRNIENLNFIVQNKFRPIEDVIKYTDEDEDSQNKFKRTIEKDKDKNESKPNKLNLNSEQNSDDLYDCSFCGHTNKIYEKNNICIKCSKMNDKIVNRKIEIEEKKLNKTNSRGNIKYPTSKNKTIQNNNSSVNDLSKDDKLRSPSNDRLTIKGRENTDGPRFNFINQETSNNFIGNEDNTRENPTYIVRKQEADKIKNEKNEYNFPKQIRETSINTILNNQSSKSIKNINIKTADDFVDKKFKKDEWKCKFCGNLYKSNENKCFNCLKRNTSVESSDKNKQIDSRKESRGPPEMNHKLIEKSYGSFVQNTRINLNSNLVQNVNPSFVNNQMNLKNTKSDFYKDKDKDEKSSDIPCVCCKFEEDKIHTLFNNNVCRICGRFKSEKSLKTDAYTNYTTTNNGNCNLRKSTEQSNQSSVGKSSILTDLNKRLSALRTKDEKILNINMNNHKSNTNIKTENVKFIGDNGTNLERKKNNDNFNQHNSTKDIDSPKNQYLTNNQKDIGPKKDIKVDVGMRNNFINPNQKCISSPSKGKIGSLVQAVNNTKYDLYSKYKK